MLNLTAGGLSGGYRKYLHRVVPLLRAEGTITELVVVVPPGHEATPGVGANPWTWNPGEHWRGYPGLRARVRAWKPDVVYIPTARYINCQAPTLIMVQNMLPMLPPTFRDGLVSWAKLRLDAALAQRANRSATRVIAVSKYVRDFLTTEWRVPEANIGVVYHGVDSAIPASELAPSSLPQGRFFFTAGSLFTYRGLEDIVAAIGTTPSDVRLVIAGEGSASYQSQMRALAEQHGVADRVVWLGQVNPATMIAAYQSCVAFVMTSRVEACPNIALEAMAEGARCISTSCDPMPEFFGAHALYYQAGDVRTLGTHLHQALGETSDRVAQHRAASQMRAADFTWDDTLRGVVRELKLTQAAKR